MLSSWTFFSLWTIALIPTGTFAAIGFDPFVKCLDLPAHDMDGVADTNGAVSTVCFTSSFVTPSPAAMTLPNGTDIVEYVGPFGFTYEFWEGLEEDTNVEELAVPADFKAPPELVDVSWKENQDECMIEIGGVACDSCTVCAGGASPQTTQVDADCRNIPTGRIVQCENVEPIIYPIATRASNISVETEEEDTSDGESCYYCVAFWLVLSIAVVAVDSFA